MAEERYTFPLRRAAMEALSHGAAEAIISALVERASAGDIKSAEFIRDLAGEKTGGADSTFLEAPTLGWDEKMEIIARLRSMPDFYDEPSIDAAALRPKPTDK